MLLNVKELPSVVTAGKLADFKLVQLLNALGAIDSALGKLAVTRLVQLSNAELPMDVTLEKLAVTIPQL